MIHKYYLDIVTLDGAQIFLDFRLGIAIDYEQLERNAHSLEIGFNRLFEKMHPIVAEQDCALLFLPPAGLAGVFCFVFCLL